MGFEYVRPASVGEAIDVLRRGDEDARPIAGGQSLLPMISLGLAGPSCVVDVSQLQELRGVRVDGDHLVIGSSTTHAELLESDEVIDHAPLLAAAASHIGSPRIRNRGTIGGSLAHGDPMAELATACWALGAWYRLLGPNGERLVTAEDFSQGYYMTALADDEVLASVHVPLVRGGWGFHEYSRRAGDFALAAAAASVQVEKGIVTLAQVVVAGAADRPRRLDAVAAALQGQEVARALTVMPDVSELVDPHDDAYVPASYRRQLISVLARRAVRDAISHDKKDAA